MDETSRLIDMGFEVEIKYIIKALQATDSRYILDTIGLRDIDTMFLD